MTTALVGIAGTLGLLAPYGISRLTLHSEALMWSTVGIIIAGSFPLGLLVAEHWFDRDVREALGVGFLWHSRLCERRHTRPEAPA
jgi:hypothetical protein